MCCPGPNLLARYFPRSKSTIFSSQRSTGHVKVLSVKTRTHARCARTIARRSIRWSSFTRRRTGSQKHEKGGYDLRSLSASCGSLTTLKKRLTCDRFTVQATHCLEMVHRYSAVTFQMETPPPPTICKDGLCALEGRTPHKRSLPDIESI